MNMTIYIHECKLIYTWVPIEPVDPKTVMGFGPSHVLKSEGSGIAVPGQAGGGDWAAAEQ